MAIATNAPQFLQFGAGLETNFTHFSPVSGCSGAAAVELAQHAVGGQQLQRQRIYLLKAAGGLVPQLGVMALQREPRRHGWLEEYRLEKIKSEEYSP